MNITGKAKVAGVMGWPVEHSLSPRLHGYWLREYKIDGAFIPLAVEPDDLYRAIRALPALGFAGANLTVPHKEAALGAVDRGDENAARIGAINTLVVSDDGSIEGRNTDGFGFVEALAASADLAGLRGQSVALLGAGGAARAIVAALQDCGVGEIYLVNRTLERAERMRDDLGGKIVAVDWDERTEVLADVKLLVNTTTLGMVGQPILEINLEALPVTAIVSDVIYSPLMTDLLNNAAKRGNLVVDGLGMLLHQARPGFYSWFNREPKVTEGLRSHILDRGAI